MQQVQYDEYGEPIDAHYMRHAYAYDPYGGSGWSGGGGYGSHEVVVLSDDPRDIKSQYPQEEEVDESPRYVESSATQEGYLDEDGHLQVADMFGVQEAYLDATIAGSLEELETHPHMTVWKPTSEVLDSLRNNTRTVDRQNASEKDYTGDLKRVIILKAKVVDTMNDSPKQVGMTVTGIEPRVASKNKKFVWRINANSGDKTVNQEVGFPNNIFTARMLKKQEACDLQSLDEEIVFGKSKKPNHEQVDVNGFAWDIIMKNVACNPDWAQHADLLYDIDGQRERGELRHHLADIPAVIARDVYGAIKEQLIPIEKSYVDLNKFQVSFSTADGSAWNDPTSLVGESDLYDNESRLALRSEALQKKRTIGAMIHITYVVRGGGQK